MTLEGAPHLKAEHYPVFDCANPCGRIGKRYLSVESHIRMMAAAQPFISGAISKTINMPNDATVEDCKDAYMLSWKLGAEGERALPRRLEAVAAAQRRSSSTTTRTRTTRRVEALIAANAAGRAPRRSPSGSSSASSSATVREREKLPDRRKGYTQKADRRRPQGLSAHRRIRRRPPRRDLHRHAQGRRRLPLADEQFRHRDLARPAIRRAARGISSRPSPSPASSRPGFVQGNDAIKNATSILDYIFRELAISYLGRNDLAHVQPEDLGSTTIGRGVEAEKPAPAPVSNGFVRGQGSKFRVLDNDRSRVGRRAARTRAGAATRRRPPAPASSRRSRPRRRPACRRRPRRRSAAS